MAELAYELDLLYSPLLVSSLRYGHNPLSPLAISHPSSISASILVSLLSAHRLVRRCKESRHSIPAARMIA
jgi:hypothetical protein